MQSKCPNTSELFLDENADLVQGLPSKTFLDPVCQDNGCLLISFIKPRDIIKRYSSNGTFIGIKEFHLKLVSAIVPNLKFAMSLAHLRNYPRDIHGRTLLECPLAMDSVIIRITGGKHDCAPWLFCNKSVYSLLD